MKPNHNFTATFIFNTIKNGLAYGVGINPNITLETFFTKWISNNLSLAEISYLQEYRDTVGKIIFKERLVEVLIASGRFHLDVNEKLCPTMF